MEFSAWPSVTNPWHELLEEATHIEKAGWKGLWIGDHVMPSTPDTAPDWQEAWTVLAAIAARVPRIRLGTLVTSNTFRNPCILAKQAAQVDIISEGRVTLGLGAGWQENEHIAFGLEFGTAQERSERLEESTHILRTIFDTGCVTFQGKHYEVEGAQLAPRPVQDHLPILIGGAGEKRTMGIVAKYADEWNLFAEPDEIKEKAKALEEHCEREGRDPTAIHRAANMLVNIEAHPIEGGHDQRPGWVSVHRAHELVDALTPYAEAGLDEMVIHFNPGVALPRRKELLTEFMGQVAPAFA